MYLLIIKIEEITTTLTRKIIYGSLSLPIILAVYVVYDYRVWTQETRIDLDGVELVNLTNREMNRLSTLQCSNSILVDLEELVELYNAQISRSETQEHVYLYSDMQDVYAKLGYIYEQAGKSELGNLNYGLAIEYGNFMTPSFYDSDSIRLISRRSKRGCFIRE